MTSTITNNQTQGIFGCVDKFREHSKLYEKHYTARDVVEHLRNSLFNLAKKMQLDCFMNVKPVNTDIEEQFRFVSDHFTLSVSFISYGSASNYLSLVKNPCTFLNYNKHISLLGQDIQQESKEGVLEFINSLMYLHRREFAFNCDYDDGCFDIRFESRKNRFNVEINVTVH